ncbi:MAG: lamin tail domain-containing protein [Myxococcales bacterium]|nr:lamin tail domain-containing protein [Myxococcales bacterium]
MFLGPAQCRDVGGAPDCTFGEDRFACAADEMCVDGHCEFVPGPCDPNPCVNPPPASCQGEDRVTYAAVGACAVVGGAAECTYAPQVTPCAAGRTCVDGVCEVEGGARAPAPGEVLVNEILYDPHGPLAETSAEWVELHNTTGEVLDLEGCLLTDGVELALPIEGLVLQADAYVVFARSVDPSANGGLDVHPQPMPFGLGNGGDTVALTCGGVTITSVTYDDGGAFPDARFASIALDPGAADPTAGGSWCLGRSPYFDPDGPTDDHYGTPGGPNPPCDELVDYCALQHPLDIQATEGQIVTVYGRLFEQGVTDRTDRTDPAPAVLAELGVGPDGSDPAVAGGWQWIPGGPNPAWQGVGFPDASNDEYQADLMAPAEGTYDVAWRFSVDGGRNWTYCDREPEGSSDGYAPADAGTLTSAAGGDACDPNPCVDPPADECADGATVRTYGAPGVCVDQAGVADCQFPMNEIPCFGDFVCVDGACVAPAVVPQPGELVFTEIMYDPHDDLADATAEWFEVVNVTDAALTLDGCSVADTANNAVQLAGVVGPGAVLLYARSADAGVNGGLQPDGTFNFDLNNGGDSLTLRCGGGVVIDAVSYDDGGAFPNAQKASISLRPGATDAAQNDDGANWCLGTQPYSVDAGGSTHRGTPGQPNPPCPATVGFCRTQFPESVREQAQADVVFYGRVYVQGITDRTPGTDVDPAVVAQFGYGPDGSLPSAGINWSWTQALPNVGYDGNAQGEPNNDEYQHTQRLPAPGTYDFAWRFSADAGATWTYCDTGAGSSNGYAAADAGDLVVEGVAGDPCDPNPCLAPPPATCADATTVRSFGAPGACQVLNGAPECTYAPTDTACAGGQTCVQGICRDPLGAPTEGELAITEIMYDPHGALSDANAEWFEIYNTTVEALDLGTCVVRENGGQQVALAGTLQAGSYLLLARSADPGVNGGLQPDLVFGFDLGNGGETLTIECGGATIDTVTYDDGPLFPDAQFAALSLSPAASDEAAENDDGANWCLAPLVYFVSGQGDHFGSPGQQNPACPVPIDLCRYQRPADTMAFAGDRFQSFGRVLQAGITDRTVGVDVDPNLRAQLGVGPVGSLPEGNVDWAWHEGFGNFAYSGNQGDGEPDLDEYQVEIDVPELGAYDLAWRFSADAGTTWTYCDLDGSNNGYQPAEAGALEVVERPDPCEPNPCAVAPPPDCAPDGVTVRTYVAPGVCTDVGGAPSCAHDPGPTTDCAANGQVCADGACVAAGAAPQNPGDVLITEVMYDPHGALADSAAEWIELYNPTAGVLSLDGCVLTDLRGSASALTIQGLNLAPGAFALFAANVDPAQNGNLPPVHQAFQFALSNNGDSVLLICDGVDIDAIQYDDGGQFPDAQFRSISLDPGAFDHTANDQGLNWCVGTTRYFQSPQGDHFGTPGAANPACPEVDTEIDECVLHRPIDVAGGPGDLVTVYGRLTEAGLTDLTSDIDFVNNLRVEAGYGPAGSNPDGSFDWFWSLASGVVPWDDAAAGAVGQDEYEAVINVPFQAGDYDVAYRVSLDAGNTWTYCDGDGAANGYDAAQAGNLSVEADPCQPNPCFDPPPSYCDGNEVVSFDFQGTCEVVDGAAACSYVELFRQNCDDLGGVCMADEFAAFCNF